MFPQNSAFDVKQYEIPEKKSKEEPPKAEEDKSLTEAVLWDLNELIEDIAAVNRLDEDETRELQVKLEDMRDTLYSTFSTHGNSKLRPR